MGQMATPANERRYENDQLATVFEKTDELARLMDECGYHAIWLAEHHFQHEGYECIPNILMVAVHLAHITPRIKIGCGFNIAPMWHPLRLAEDFATADILTRGRTIFGVGRGYHSREVETFGAPILDGEANRELFEDKGEIPLGPRPIPRPGEVWQPIVSAKPRALDFMVRHRIKGVIGGGAATMAEGPVHAYREAAQRAGRDLALGGGLCLGIFFHLADTREKAIREITPYYEEHRKMLAPLGFVPGIPPGRVETASRRGGWGAAGVPSVEHYTKTGAWFAGPPEDLVAHLKDLESRFPGLQHVNMSLSMGTPKAVMLEQLRWFAKEVMPKFSGEAF